MSKSPSLRRIQADVRELALDPSDRYYAAPLENDMFEWHFTIRGAEDTEFEGGIYHGRILLPPEYPFKPPHIVFLTPSGRFEINTKVCLSFSAFHPELWQPAWGIRLILEALISFLPTPADGAIGALDWSKEERKRLATLSQNYTCAKCGQCSKLLPELDEAAKKKASTRFAKEIAELQRLQQVAEKKKTSPQTDAKEKDSDGNEGTSEDKEAQAIITSISQEAPEEEIVFGDENGGSSGEASCETKAGEDDDDEANHKAPTPLEPIAAENLTRVGPEETEEAILHVNDPSWMYDPLLNLMLVLMSVICYLLIQKYQELMEELDEIRQLSSGMP